MANRQRAEARKKAAAKAAHGGSSKLWMWATLGIVVVVAIVGAVIAFGGDDEAASPGTTEAPGTTESTDGTDGTDTTDSSDSSDTSVEEELTPNPPVDGKAPDSQPTRIDGDALTIYDAQAPIDDSVGAAAPIITGFNFDGETMVIDAATDGPTMVVFLAHWCSHCNAEVPVLIDWNTLGGVPDNLNVIGVATAIDPSQPNYPPADWFEAKRWPWPVLVDTKVSNNHEAGLVAQAFGASAWPYMVIIGEDGLVKLRISGEHSAAELSQMVDAALSS